MDALSVTEGIDMGLSGLPCSLDEAFMSTVRCI